nr:hypothetical protein RVX_2872 [Nitratidesulfovibrio sp. HK-II]
MSVGHVGVARAEAGARGQDAAPRWRAAHLRSAPEGVRPT